MLTSHGWPHNGMLVSNHEAPRPNLQHHRAPVTALMRRALLFEVVVSPTASNLLVETLWT